MAQVFSKQVGSISIPACLCWAVIPSQELLSLFGASVWSSQVWLGHGKNTAKTRANQRACQQEGGYQVGQPTQSRRGGERKVPLHKQGLTPNDRVTRGLCRAAARRKSPPKHNPPHSTKTNTKGHPNFSIRAPGGGRKWIRVASLPNPPPSWGVPSLGKRGKTDIHREEQSDRLSARTFTCTL